MNRKPRFLCVSYDTKFVVTSSDRGLSLFPHARAYGKTVRSPEPWPIQNSLASLPLNWVRWLVILVAVAMACAMGQSFLLCPPWRVALTRWPLSADGGVKESRVESSSPASDSTNSSKIVVYMDFLAPMHSFCCMENEMMAYLPLSSYLPEISRAILTARLWLHPLSGKESALAGLFLAFALIAKSSGLAGTYSVQIFSAELFPTAIRYGIYGCLPKVIYIIIFSALLTICEGNPPVTSGFALQRASAAELWCFLWCRPA